MIRTLVVHCIKLVQLFISLFSATQIYWSNNTGGKHCNTDLRSSTTGGNQCNTDLQSNNNVGVEIITMHKK